MLIPPDSVDGFGRQLLANKVSNAKKDIMNLTFLLDALSLMRIPKPPSEQLDLGSKIRGRLGLYHTSEGSGKI